MRGTLSLGTEEDQMKRSITLQQLYRHISKTNEDKSLMSE